MEIQSNNIVNFFDFSTMCNLKNIKIISNKIIFNDNKLGLLFKEKLEKLTFSNVLDINQYLLPSIFLQLKNLKYLQIYVDNYYRSHWVLDLFSKENFQVESLETLNISTSLSLEIIYHRLILFFPNLKNLILDLNERISYYRIMEEKNYQLSDFNFPPSLRSLKITLKKLENQKFLNGLDNLEYLSINKSDYNFEFLKRLKKLKYFQTDVDQLEENEEKTIDFSENKNLRFLSLFKFAKSVDDRTVQSISSLSFLNYLSLDGCSEIKDISPLSKLPNLTYLNTENIAFQKVFDSFHSLIKWDTTCASSVFNEIKDLNSFPNLTCLNVNRDQKLSEKAFQNIFSLPNISEINLYMCNFNENYLKLVVFSSKLKKFELNKSEEMRVKMFFFFNIIIFFFFIFIN